MAYSITLTIDGKEKVYTRNGEPVLRDMTQALKVQQGQLRMQLRENGPTDQDFEENERHLAEFAVSFWNRQFSAQEVIDGADNSSLDAINKAIEDSLDDGSAKKDDEPAKKSRTRTSKKQ